MAERSLLHSRKITSHTANLHLNRYQGNTPAAPISGESLTLFSLRFLESWSGLLFYFLYHLESLYFHVWFFLFGLDTSHMLPFLFDFPFLVWLGVFLFFLFIYFFLSFFLGLTRRCCCCFIFLFIFNCFLMYWAWFVFLGDCPFFFVGVCSFCFFFLI